MPLNGGRASGLSSRAGNQQLFFGQTMLQRSIIKSPADKSQKNEWMTLRKNTIRQKKVAENDFPKIKNDDQTRLSSRWCGLLSEKITRVKKVLLTTKESATIFWNRSGNPSWSNHGKELRSTFYTAETKPEREWHYGSMLYAYDLTTNSASPFESDPPEGTHSFAALF